MSPLRITPTFPALVLTALVAGCADRFSAPSPEDGAGEEPPPFDDAGEAREGYGLVGAAPGEDAVAVRWRVPVTAGSFAVFVGSNEGTLFDGPPALIDPPGSSAVVAGLAPNATWFVGLAVDTAGGWEPAGPVLTARTAEVVYVDPAAPPGGDGTTPGTALDTLTLGVLTAFANGGGNVWAAEGSFEEETISVPAGVDVFGGFAPGFDLAARDPDLHPTVLVGETNEDVMRFELGADTRVLDGFGIDGTAGVKNALDIDSVPVEVRGVDVEAGGRGGRLRSLSGNVVEVVVAGCSFVEMELQGISLEGSFDLVIDGSDFRRCGQEGLDLADLLAPDGATARLTVRDSLFAACGAEGLDCDLAAPLGGVVGGFFEVRIATSDFARNAQAGLRIDIDYETAPLWAASIRVEGCTARANGDDGIQFDLDSRADVLVDRVACTGNGDDGLGMTSETADGVVQVSSSLFLGNDARGVAASQGNFAPLLANCVVAGNHGGGLISTPIDGSAVSTVLYLQPDAASGALVHRSVVAGSGDLPVFVNAPQEISVVESAAGTVLTLAAPPAFAAGAVCEVDGDEVPREVLSVGGAEVELDSAPPGLTLPATLAAFEPGGTVVEDYALSPASIARDAGLPHPGGAPTDAGPFGAPFGGAPGTVDPGARSGFHLSRVFPRLGLPLDPMESVTLSFANGPVGAGSLTVGVSVVDANGDDVGAVFTVDGSGRLNAFPPGGGWPVGSVLRLHRGLRSEAGEPLAAEAALPLAIASAP